MDQFTIKVPPERQYAAVADLVLGGIAARHDLTLEALDDVQLALDSLLERAGRDGEVTIVLRVDGGTLSAVVGPLAAPTARELEREADESLGLRRLLDTVVDGVTLTDRDGSTWVELRKEFEVDRTGAGR